MDESLTVTTDRPDDVRNSVGFAAGSLIIIGILWTLLYTMAWLPIFAILLAIIFVLFAAGFLGRRGSLRSKWQVGRLLWVSIVTASFFYLCYFLVSWFLHRHYPYALQKWELIVSLRFRYKLIPAILLFGTMAIGEEIYWRGYLQEFITRRWGRDRAVYATALLYAGIHIPANAPLLFFSALFAGIYWSWIYSRARTIWVTLIAHTLWAVAVTWLIPMNFNGNERYVSLIKALFVA